MAPEKTKRPGFTIDLKAPYKPAFVACMVVTPYRGDGTRRIDASKKLERDLGRAKALQLAAELLAYCNAPADLVERVKAIRTATTGVEAESDGDAPTEHTSIS